jgi:hypothetical protein
VTNDLAKTGAKRLGCEMDVLWVAWTAGSGSGWSSRTREAAEAREVTMPTRTGQRDLSHLAGAIRYSATVTGEAGSASSGGRWVVHQVRN